MTGLRRMLTQGAAGALLVLTAATFGQAAIATGAGAAPVVRAALAPGSINNILVIELENEDATETFGPGSVATYLNGTLVPKGELLENYYAIGHVSLDNYIAEISGQAPTPLTDSDCNLTGYQQRHSRDRRPEHRDLSRAGRRQRLRLPGADGHDARSADHRQSARRGRPHPTRHPRGLLAGVRRGHGQRSDARRGSDGPARRDRLRASGGGRHGRRRLRRSQRPVRDAARPLRLLPFHHRQHRGM